MIFGVIGIMDSMLCITEDEIENIVERKMERVARNYDRKIALLEEKIHAQDVKIQALEKKCSTPILDTEEERENAPFQHVSSNRGNDTSIQKKSYVSSSHENQIRVVQGTVKWLYN